MLDIGFQELLLIMVIALLVFGPYKLPELGRALGRALREFRRASDEFRSTIETNLNLTEEPSWVSPIVPTVTDSPVAEAAPDPAVAPGSDAGGEAVAPAADSGASRPAITPTAESEPAPFEPFVARRGGRLLHRRECGWLARVLEPERVPFKRAAEGFELGLVACPVCEPRDEEPREEAAT